MYLLKGELKNMKQELIRSIEQSMLKCLDNAQLDMLDKTFNRLNQLKNEYETLNKKLKELTEDELLQVTGGTIPAMEEVIRLEDYSNNK